MNTSDHFMQMFVGHLIASAVCVSLFLLAVDAYFNTYFITALLQTWVLCPLERHRYLFAA
jgi:hypothetical protein